MSNLIIVESPTKIKTIKRYLSDDYEVVASKGHVRDLPKSKLGVDIDNNFEPKYVNIKDKEGVIKDIKKLSFGQKPKITHQKIARNEPCPCGSGKKYKRRCINP